MAHLPLVSVLVDQFQDYEKRKHILKKGKKN